MTIRFFILQAHYRGTVDFSNEALKSAEKALERMLDGYKRLANLKANDSAASIAPQIEQIKARAYEAMDDDLNTPVLIGVLFDAVRLVNQINDGAIKANSDDIKALRAVFDTFLVEILGIRVENAATDTGSDAAAYASAMDLLFEIRAKAKAAKDWATSDLIRDRLAQAGFDVKDTKDGVEWKIRH